MKKQFTVCRIVSANILADKHLLRASILYNYLTFDEEINALRAIDEMVRVPENKNVTFTILITYTKND